MNAFNKLEKEHAAVKKELQKLKKQITFYEPFEKFCASIFKGQVKLTKPPKKIRRVERVVNTIWSDLHFGADIAADETGNANYGRKEEARRFAALVEQIATFKSSYRKEQILKIGLIGDIIQNMLHDPRDGAPLAEQVARAIHLLVAGITYLANHFSQVEVHCTTGNHGRNVYRHQERATNQKWDSIETMVYVAVKYACMNLPNVKFFIPKTPWVVVESFGMRMFFTHGDTVIKPGNPGAAIKVDALEKQVNKINASLPDSKEYKVFAVGHVHVPSITTLGNGATLITNGALVPIDQFATSIGNLESQCGQWIWETVEGHAVGDQRLIKVGQEQDKDKSLDKIVPPWKEL